MCARSLLILGARLSSVVPAVSLQSTLRTSPYICLSTELRLKRRYETRPRPHPFRYRFSNAIESILAADVKQPPPPRTAVTRAGGRADEISKQVSRADSSLNARYIHTPNFRRKIRFDSDVGGARLSINTRNFVLA